MTQPSTDLDTIAERLRTLSALVEERPDNLSYCAQLATLLDTVGDTEAAIGQYRRLLRRQPGIAAAHYNLALLLKKQMRYADALDAYNTSVRLGIDGLSEVYSNIGVLYSEMRQANEAREMYARALEVDSDYIPALFNLAGLLEEAGERDEAQELYRRILGLEPRHWDSLARLAYTARLTDPDDPLIGSLRTATDAKVDDLLAREGLYFALGKVLDDVGQYDAAFAAYKSANELGKQRGRPYDRFAAEQAFDELTGWCNEDWISSAKTSCVASPIFICGMFRSGSTLLEQVLAAHPSITAGGELDMLPKLMGRWLKSYPRGPEIEPADTFSQLANEYVSKRQELFQGAEHITDKRPDNYVHLGMIKALFPQARIVYTARNPLDNCLSVYFQQLGGNLSYATDLTNIAHYYRLHQRLMQHWQACLPENIFVVEYDELVRSPEPLLRSLFDFLELEWDERCLEFQKTDNLVKTASVWQVREELYQRSSGRWRNYERFFLSSWSQ